MQGYRLNSGRQYHLQEIIVVIVRHFIVCGIIYLSSKHSFCDIFCRNVSR